MLGQQVILFVTLWRSCLAFLLDPYDAVCEIDREMAGAAGTLLISGWTGQPVRHMVAANLLNMR